jgi:4,5-dihydroxyphthalate decarboxylase
LVTIDITLTVGPHDFLGPLARGEVTRPGQRVRLDHRTPMDRTLNGAAMPASEASLSRYLMMQARGDERYCGLPFFILRGFRHRFFFVRHDSELRSLPDLRGRRVGITAWFDTGNTWTKAMLHDAGVAVGDLEWVLGPLEPGRELKLRHQQEPTLPTNVSTIEPGQTLITELHAGRLNAIVAPLPPATLGQHSGVRRLIVNYRPAEEEYFRRTSIYPACHIVVVDRRLVRDQPGLLLGIFDILVASWETWIAHGFLYPDGAPWVLPALEEAAEVLGPAWRQHGLETPANRLMLQTLADEQVRQGHMARWADPLAAFEHYAAQLANRR